MDNKTGKFIVLEGLDGSGKSVQYERLRQYLSQNGYKLAWADFPNYQSSFHGRLVGKYLRGEFGDVNEVDPHFSSWLYAGDRLEAKEKLLDWLAEGCILLTNRYVGSNLAYHTAKVPPAQRLAFMQWLKSLEYDTNGLPKEDLVVYFYVPVATAQRMVDRKEQRSYITERRDIHERNAAYLQAVNDQYLNLCGTEPNWVAFDVADPETGELLDPEIIHLGLVNFLKERGFL